MPPPSDYTPAQAARLLGVAKKTILRSLADGRLHGARVPSRYSTGWEWRIGATELEGFRPFTRLECAARAGITKPGLSYEQEARAVTMYGEGQTSTAIAKTLGVSKPVVLHALHRHRVAMRPPGARAIYSANHAFFATIASEQQAYWLGFLAADGCCKGNALSLSLQRKDADHLKRFADALQSTHPVKHYHYLCTKGGPTSGISIRSHRLVNDLARHGVTARKTFTFQWPDLPAPLIRHFVRGYTDGDGGFYVTAPRPPRTVASLLWSVTSNKRFLLAMQDHIMEACFLKRRTVLNECGDTGLIGVLQYGGNRQVLRIAHYLYDGATVFLPRKRDKIAAYL